MKHTDIRAAVLDALEQHEHGATLFDGRPVVFDEEDFPAIAVYLTDAEYTGEELDADTWRATLHIEVFLPAQVPDAYHLAGIDMPDFEREDDWWRNGQNLYLDNMAVTGFYRVPLSSAQAGDILLCCFGASVPNHAAIYCGNGELLHHLPEQLSKRERYSEKWQRRTHSVWRHRHWHASAFTGIYNDLAAASACM